MNAHIFEWLSLVLRWGHILAAIGWIGSSLYFMWLDAALERDKVAEDPDLEGKLWMVHSGGFYRVERRLLKPGGMPGTLHWFKWEAMFTWLTGVTLLSLIYYGRAALYLIDPAHQAMSVGQAIGLSLAIIASSWLAYDTLWSSRLAQKQPIPALVISISALLGLIVLLTQYFSGRGAYIHVGAILGTIMVLNVWVRILPAQQKMVDATRAGLAADQRLSAQAKYRSVHNSYMTLPVLFTMISPHYPMTFGHSQNALVLSLAVLFGGLLRHVMIVAMRHKSLWPSLAPAIAVAGALVFLTFPRSAVSSAVQASAPAAAIPAPTPVEASAHTQTEIPAHIAAHTPPEASPPPVVGFTEVKALVAKHCLSCHSQHPSNPAWPLPDPPLGLSFELDETIQNFAFGIRDRVVVSKTMPLGNTTGMTEAEREQVRVWVDSLPR